MLANRQANLAFGTGWEPNIWPLIGREQGAGIGACPPAPLLARLSSTWGCASLHPRLIDRRQPS